MKIAQLFFLALCINFISFADPSSLNNRTLSLTGSPRTLTTVYGNLEHASGLGSYANYFLYFNNIGGKRVGCLLEFVFGAKMNPASGRFLNCKQTDPPYTPVNIQCNLWLYGTVGKYDGEAFCNFYQPGDDRLKVTIR